MSSSTRSRRSHSHLRRYVSKVESQVPSTIKNNKVVVVPLFSLSQSLHECVKKSPHVEYPPCVVKKNVRQQVSNTRTGVSDGRL